MNEYIYCIVRFLKKDGTLSQSTWSYLTKDESLQKEDWVLVPMGKDNVERVVFIEEVLHLKDGDEFPYPPELTKHVIKKIDPLQKEGSFFIRPQKEAEEIFPDTSLWDGKNWCEYINNTLKQRKETKEEEFKGNLLLEEVVIPEGVTKIKKGTFENCENLKTVVLPQTLTCIEERAFSGCFSLANINIPKNTIKIEEWAFQDCKVLTSIKLPTGIKMIRAGVFKGCVSLSVVQLPGVKQIRIMAFEGCSSLTSIIVGEDNQTYQTIDGNLYSKDGKVLLQYAIGKPEECFEIPEGVEKVSCGAFRGCTSLKSVIMPETVKKIDFAAFDGCSSLKSIIILLKFNIL